MKDISGQTFGMWKVIGFSKVGNGGTKAYWECQCVCGTTRDVRGSDLRSGHSTNCGCKSANAVKRIGKSGGMSNTRTYWSWISMIKRCTAEPRRDYKYYGGRGINVCDRWRASFLNFLEDMGERPLGKTLDRIDNNLGYTKENCKWSTPSEQVRNRRPYGKKTRLRGPVTATEAKTCPSSGLIGS